jgi:LmbE family N-acetylglucosaminyl deacetylase
MTAAPNADRSTVVVLHAHPDDEAIFTGGTLRLLADRGVRTVVAFATDGALGLAPDGSTSDELGTLRRAEAEASARIIGAERVVWLGFADSGLTPPARPTPGSVPSRPALVHVPLADVAAAVRRLLLEERASCLVGYDAHGIYGHPDHVVVHRAGSLSTEGTNVVTRYEATVDREHLHFVETHLVAEARRAGLAADDPSLGDARGLDLRHVGIPECEASAGGLGVEPGSPRGLSGSGYGVPTVLIDLAVDVRNVVGAKRSAMAAHASQIPPDSSALRLGAAAFGDVYGTEWYLRHGPPGPLDDLPRR